jgi:hypothetical protein
MKQAVVLALAALVLVAPGCGTNKDSSSDSFPPAQPAKQSPLGPFFGECGNVTDDEVRAAIALPNLPIVYRNSSGCIWESGAAGSGPSVSFSWYRGSPIGRERAGSDRIGRPPEEVDIDGHKGFLGSASDELCEVGLQYGDDFFHWSLTYGLGKPTTDVCKATRHLAELTASRVK